MELIIQQPSAFSFVYVRYDKIENRNDHIKETRQENRSSACSANIMNYEFRIMNCLGGVVERDARPHNFFTFYSFTLKPPFYSFTFLPFYF